ncbi:Rad4-domain-containing protein [Lentinus tigrinus ALCF2SS1-7]|uniref:Rad4-domain-containing protein n=1 Tax=Lentinus tigrinus ALCF2SS1-6 TaxID=1328759 RepID=A0A5C2SET6_9APHY|nr:Rad4-domain-containing protein [Lentinus tigrinus ALCF2SS1-6]RPD77972.1 Rad4-domain-containing protein [Lentinus tigrinus ALCF2SS1-7]
MNMENSSVLGEESEDDFDWEEVEVAQTITPADASGSASAVAPSLGEYYGDTHDTEEGPSQKPHLEITIKTLGKAKGGPKKNERALQIAAERAIRVDCHKIHTISLLVNAKIRNKWLNDPLLHARLMSLTPLALQDSFAMITKSRFPEPAKRGRMFESAITRLADWWSSTFEIVPTGHIRSRTFEEVNKTLPPPKRAPPPDPKGKGKARAVEEDDEDLEERYGIDGERIRSEKSLMKHALMRKGSRDTSAQLFTALCRALGIPARLVVSLQSVPWQASVGKPKPTAKKKKKKTHEGGSDTKGKGKADGAGGGDNDDMEDVAIPSSSAVDSSRGRTPFQGNGQRLDGASPTQSDKGKGKQKAPPVIRLRKSKGGQKLGSATTSEAERPRPRERTPDPADTAPVFWTEVFSRADTKWLPVDPVRVIVNRRKAFDPTPNPNVAKPDRRRPVRVENRMVYVLAFEEDGYARDVTPRYAREYGAKVSKVQQGGKGRREWWDRIRNLVQRPYRLQRDDLEDEELQAHQMTEAMPTSMAGFKDHPLYVLSRHLKREEVVDPPVELGKFRGEPVYPRANVLQLKTAENWMRQGRRVVVGAQPLKWVKQRAVTVNKKRAIEVALADRRERTASASGSAHVSASASVNGRGEDGEEDFGDAGLGGGDGLAVAGEGFAAEDGVMQGLYAEHQTELYKPPPVVDGKVPKNDFGNIDLYVPSMLPAGAAYIPHKGTAKIARQLGFDYAEAVTGFEFKKRRAFPVITGIVIAEENESALLEAYWEAEQEADAKRRAKRQEQVIKRWTKLVQGLRIRQRLVEQYADRAPAEDAHAQSEAAAEKPTAEEEPEKPAAGGFLTGVDDVVQPYALPRNLHEVVERAAMSHAALGELKKANLNLEEEDGSMDTDEHVPEAPFRDIKLEVLEDSEDDDDDDMMEDVPVAPRLNGAPKTMQELAEEAARREGLNHESADTEEELTIAAPVEKPATIIANTTIANGRNTRSDGASTTGTSTPRTRAKAKAGARGRAAAGTSTPRQTRKRTRAQADSDVEGEGSQPSPAKRRARTSAAPSPAVMPSTRVLRARKPKDASKVQEEEEMEEAYRRAITE